MRRAGGYPAAGGGRVRGRPPRRTFLVASAVRSAKIGGAGGGSPGPIVRRRIVVFGYLRRVDRCGGSAERETDLWTVWIDAG